MNDIAHDVVQAALSERNPLIQIMTMH